MTEQSFSSIHFVFFILIINILNSEEQTIYFGNCPLVIGGKCDSTDVKFYLYTRFNPKVPAYVEFKEDGKDNLTASAYDWRLGNKLIIHGYSSDMNLDVLQNLKDEYLISSNANIWMVNYPNIVVSPCYPFAVYNIKYVGKCIANFVKRLNDTVSYKLDMHVIGFSLGGQVPNYVAQFLPFKLPRITGLDPALPLFYTSVLSQRLDPSDAQFVDVIHTNALLQGQVFPCGHIDFYVNGGVIQPGCTGPERFNCYHSRSVEYFTESINTQVGFWGWYCPSFLDFIEYKCKPKEPLKIMGEYVDQGARGVYLLNTASKSPYAKGKNILDVGSNETRPQQTLKQMMYSVNWTTMYSKQINPVENNDIGGYRI